MWTQKFKLVGPHIKLALPCQLPTTMSLSRNISGREWVRWWHFTQCNCFILFSACIYIAFHSFAAIVYTSTYTQKLSLCGQILIFLQHTLPWRHLLPKSFTGGNASDTDNLLMCATRVKKGNSELYQTNILCEYMTWLMNMACKHLIKSSRSCSALREDESSATVT